MPTRPAAQSSAFYPAKEEAAAPNSSPSASPFAATAPSLPAVPVVTSLEPWLDLANRLREVGLTNAWLQQRYKACADVPKSRQAGWLRAELAEEDSWTARAALLFCHGQVLSAPVCRSLLSPGLFAAMSALGLLQARGRNWRSAFRLELVNQLYLFSDHPMVAEQAVMAFGPTTEVLLKACYPQQDVDSVLDLGCGGGALALLLADAAKRVVGCDINPRAVALARLNAALNGISNATFREGDLFAPVTGERFALIVSQPPFVARTPQQRHVQYLHGGWRGDELLRRVLEQAPAHLQADGLAMVMADVPVLQPEAPLASVWREGAADQPRLTAFVSSTPTTLLAHATTYFAYAYGLEGAALRQQSQAMMAHLRGFGVQALQQAILVLQPAAPGPSGPMRQPPAAVWRVADSQWPSLGRAEVDRILRAAQWQAMPLAQKLAAKLRFAPGLRWQRSGVVPETDDAPAANSTWTLLPPTQRASATGSAGSFDQAPGPASPPASPAAADEAGPGMGLLGNPQVGEELWNLLHFVDDSETVQEGMRQFLGLPEDAATSPATAHQAATQQMLHALEQMLVYGVLEAD